MKYIRLDLLTLLISLFVLGSCTSPDQVGLEVDPSRAIDLQSFDTVTVRTVTVEDDTIVTSGLAQHPLGMLNDDPQTFGKTESRLAMSLTLPTSSFSFGTSPVLDSAVLVLKYGDEFYGDSVNSHYTIEVRQLDKEYVNTTAYSNRKTWTANPTVIGSKSIIKFGIKDSVQLTQLVDGKPDVVKRTAPHLRIPISNAFIQNALINANSTDLATQAAFSKYFKGLYVTVKTQSAAEKGGVVFLNLAQADSSRLEVYYKNFDTTIDSNMVKFGVSNANTSANITHQYGPAVTAQTGLGSGSPAATVNFATVYAQPMSGLRTRVLFPYLSKLKAMSNIIINRAELVVKVDGGTTPAYFDPAKRLRFYQTDIAAQRQEIPDNNVGQKDQIGDPRGIAANSSSGYYNSTTKEYVFSLTSYIQDIVSGRSQQYYGYIAPLKNSLVSTYGDQSDLLPASTTAGRSILGGGNGTAYKMRLIVVYTKLK